MGQNFGFNKRSDGTCEVYHHGEYFYGPWPVRLIFELHGRYLIWASEKHVNSPAFSSKSEAALEEKEAMRKNIPAHVFNEFISQLEADIKSTLGGSSISAEKREQVEKVLVDIQKAKLKKHTTSIDVKHLKQHNSQNDTQMLQLIIDNKEVRDSVKAGMDVLAKNEKSGGRTLA